MRAKTAVVLGAQWGDEGKGKIVDVLSERFSAVARYAGGHNAGHTVIHRRTEVRSSAYSLRRAAAGLQRRDWKRRGAGSDRFPEGSGEAAELGIDVDGQLFVSNRAQVILPYHRMIELAAESAPGRQRDRDDQPRHRAGV